MPKNDRAAILIKALYQLVEKSSEEDLRALETGAASVIVVHNDGVVRTSRKPARSTKLPLPSSEELERLTFSLKEQPTREAGFAFLDGAKLTRRSLEALARRLDVPVQSDDDRSRLQGRIVEALIGARLNSEAIKGHQ